MLLLLIGLGSNNAVASMGTALTPEHVNRLAQTNQEDFADL